MILFFMLVYLVIFIYFIFYHDRLIIFYFHLKGLVMILALLVNEVIKEC